MGKTYCAIGGVGEFEITNPTIALQGSGTADAPDIIIYLNTTNFQNKSVAYNLRDIEEDQLLKPLDCLYYEPGCIDCNWPFLITVIRSRLL